MNNEEIIRSVICLLAGDGEINQQEMQFLQTLRKQFGVTTEALKAALEDARKGRGQVHLPHDEADKKRLFEFLAQAVVADKRLAPEERKMLNLIAAKMELSGIEMERILSLAKKGAARSPAAKPLRQKGTTSRDSTTRNGSKIQQKQHARKTPGRTAAVTTTSPINPKIRIENDVLYACTAWVRQLLYLFSYCRRVEVDRRKSEIRVITRWLWFFTTRKVIPFSRLAARSPFETKYAGTTITDRRRGYHRIEWGIGVRYEEEVNMRYSIVLCLERPYGRYPLITFRSLPLSLTGIILTPLEFISRLAFRTNTGEEVFQEYFDLLQEFTSE